MKKVALNAREKNLALVVVIVSALGGWWYQSRNLAKKEAVLEGDTLALEERIRQTGASVAELRAAVEAGRGAKEGAPGQPVRPQIKQSLATLSLLEDLTLPRETRNLRVVSVTRGDGGAFSMTIEGQFAEIMRYLSFLERAESRFSVGNVTLGRMDETDRQPDSSISTQRARQVRGNIQIVMKG